MKNKLIRRLIGGAIILLLLGVVVWYFWPSHLAKAKELRDELMSTAARNMDPQQRREKWQQLNREQEQLSPAERKELWADLRKKRQEDMNRYFAMSPQDKAKYLDGQIDRMEEMRKQREARRAQGGTNSPPNPNGTTLQAVVAGDPNAPAPRSQEERERRRKERLDDTTPEERAQRDQYFKELQARRTQRGLPSLGGPR